MIKIMLVDDEPSAIKYLKTIIEQKTQGFEVIDTAENGIEALQKIEFSYPDIVITDIKMPVMDGLELCSNIKSKYPYIKMVLISGYQEFEYARKAIKEGVIDYLLKPVSIDSLVELLNKLKDMIEEENYNNQINIFKRIIYDSNINEIEKRYFINKRFGIAVLREGGIPLHFSSIVYFNDKHSILPTAILNEKKIWLFEGRDQKEFIFVFSPDDLDFKAFENTLKDLIKFIDKECYYTLVFKMKYFYLEEIRNVFFEIIKILEENITLGISQIIYDEQNNKKDNVKKSKPLDTTLEKKIEFFVSNLLFDRLKEELEKNIKQWVQEKQTILWIGNTLNYILYITKKHLNIKDFSNDNIKFMLDEALYLSKNTEQLITSICNIIDALIRENEEMTNKKDTEKLLNSISNYIENNISQQFTVQSICQMFGISPTYLNVLFNKHKKMPFNKYLTNIRIEKAKKIIVDNPEIPLKDISEMIGFNDQFYFSRVFKSLTGFSPSEFKERGKK